MLLSILFSLYLISKELNLTNKLTSNIFIAAITFSLTVNIHFNAFILLTPYIKRRDLIL